MQKGACKHDIILRLLYYNIKQFGTQASRLMSGETFLTVILVSALIISPVLTYRGIMHASTPRDSLMQSVSDYSTFLVP